MGGAIGAVAAGKIKKRLSLILQQFWLSFEFFAKNGLANHAAAGAYGFLLSAAPVLIVISFFVTNILYRSPELAADMFEQIGFLSELFNAGDFVRDFLSSANPGLMGFISVVPILWAARLCALSVRRGLGVIFPGPRFGPFRAAAVSTGLGVLIIVFIFVMLLGSRLALAFFESMDFALARSLHSIILILPDRVLSLSGLFLLTLVSYRFVPVKRLQWKHIITGALSCIFFYLIFALVFSLIISPDRYSLIYGALGSLFLFLLNVYFFFYFFFFGAQLIMVQAASEALLFIRFRQYHCRSALDTKPWDRLFASPSWPLLKYLKEYKGGDLIFARGNMSDEVYYIISGKAGVYLDDECRNMVSLIEEKHFFGEIELVEEEGRTASIKAETDLSALLLPRELYSGILQMDPDTDQSIIQGLSERLKSINKLGY
ncbi:MAG: YihY/virulence factor BrkB family protein [Treponema sp.]|nr:YihY/virulence factor BrkB family protein [Treponema sp.]